MSGRSRREWLGGACAIGLIAATFAIAFATGGANHRAPSSGEAASDASHHPHRRYLLMPHIEPARLFGDADPIGSDTDMTGLTNGWTVGSHRKTTLVIGGRAGGRPSKGRIVISSEHYYRSRAPTSNGAVVDVPHAGAVKITRAPLGPKVVATAQERGILWFAGRRGVHGRLDLADDHVTITHG